MAARCAAVGAVLKTSGAGAGDKAGGRPGPLRLLLGSAAARSWTSGGRPSDSPTFASTKALKSAKSTLSRRCRGWPSLRAACAMASSGPGDTARGRFDARSTSSIGQTSWASTNIDVLSDQ